MRTIAVGLVGEEIKRAEAGENIILLFALADDLLEQFFTAKTTKGIKQLRHKQIVFMGGGFVMFRPAAIPTDRIRGIVADYVFVGENAKYLASKDLLVEAEFKSMLHKQRREASR